jgi:hypothetical protein
MIVKVERRGSRVRICSRDNSVKLSTAVSAPILARMGNSRIAFFRATSERGGGTDKEGTTYENPSEIIELDERVPDQEW